MSRRAWNALVLVLCLSVVTVVACVGMYLDEVSYESGAGMLAMGFMGAWLLHEDE